jgi:hypothetical protein
MIQYKNRPGMKDASQKVWDYISEKYGTPEKILFSQPCCSGESFWIGTIVENNQRKTVKVTPKEIKGFVKKFSKI